MDCVVTFVLSPSEFYCHIGSEKTLQDFSKLESIIQQYCGDRKSFFHSCVNVEIGEVVFLKALIKGGLYTRGKVLDIREDSCDVILLDYGNVEKGVQLVLKIDPSVKRFAEFPQRAKKCCLAYVEPVEEEWSTNAISMFNKFCSNYKLFGLPADDNLSATIIVKVGSTFVDLSEMLVQAGLAKRLGVVDNDDGVSITTSVSGASQHHHSVAVQTDSDILKTSMVRPPPGFESCQGDNPAQSLYLSSSIVDDQTKISCDGRINAESSSQRPKDFEYISLEQILSISHDIPSNSVIDFICNKVSKLNISRKEKLKMVLAQSWPALNTKQENLLRGFITGNQITSEDREFLLDVLLALPKRTSDEEGKLLRTDLLTRPCKDSSTQITSTTTRLTLSSCESTGDKASSTDDITIINQSPKNSKDLKEKTEPDSNAKHVTSLFAKEPKSQSQISSLDSMYETRTDHTTYASCDPENWSDPDDNFLSSSDDDIIVESIIKSTSNKAAAASVTMPPTKDLRSREDPKQAFLPAQKSSPKASPQRLSKPNKPLKVASYGLNLSAQKPSQSHQHLTATVKQSFAPNNSTTGGFGMIRYCIFCGSTTHGSGNCPDGTKKLFPDY